MKSAPQFLKKVSFMKRYLLSGLLLLAMGRSAFSYENDQVVQVPTMNPELIQIDTLDGNFVNRGTFDVDTTLFQSSLATTYYETSDTLNFTNIGTMAGVPGFDFEYFPASFGQPHMLANFVNIANGFGGGVIAATNIFQGVNIFQTPGNNGGEFNFGILGLATIKVRATNIFNDGLITMDSTGLMDILGNDVNLRRGQFLMTGDSFGIQVLESGFGFIGDTNLFAWNPLTELQPTFAISPPFPAGALGFEQMVLNTPTVYFESLNPQPSPANTNLIVWRVVYLQDNSPANVTKNVYFGNDNNLGFGSFHIEWSSSTRDPVTGQAGNNFFYLSDEPVDQYATNAYTLLSPVGGVPEEYTFQESPTKLTTLAPAAPGFISTPFPATVTNNFGFVSAAPTATLIDTNVVVGGNPTNLPGRIQFTSLNSLNLADVRISGENYLLLKAPVNFLGNSNAVIIAPYADINLGVTNRSLVVSNLLVPQLPEWTGVPGAPSAIFGAMGGIQAYSATYQFLDANGVTNDVRILLVNSAIQPTAPTIQKDVSFHAANSLVISDALHIYNSFFSDTAALTISTNASSAYSSAGELNLLSQNVFLSASLPNLQYVTNWGVITTKNLADFAGNMLSPFSPRSGATSLQAFVNHGTISDQGIFIFANYFENDGVIQEFPSGNIDIKVGTGTFTNATLSATNGSMSLAADSLFISNSVINAGRSLTLAGGCSLSDGYVFGNQFGHFTNSTLPNVVTNGNFFAVGGGVQVIPVTTKPATGDLLGTTITNVSVNSLDSINLWAGENRGATPSGFADNLALGRMIFVTDGNPSRFTFRPVNGNNALYVDSIEFKRGATNTDAAGNFTAFNIEPGMKIFYAQALVNGVSIAEKLNGKNGGGFMWVSNYAGVYSSTNLNYPDGKTYIFNAALVVSPNFDSDGDTVVNVNDPTPIPAGLTFDITNIGPQSCDGDGGSGGLGDGGAGTGGSHLTPGLLAFPATQSVGSGGSSNAVSFGLAQGAYSGLFYETNGVNPASSGFISAKVTGRGSISAKLQIGSKTYSFATVFNSSGNCTAFATGKGLTPLTVSLHIVNNDQLAGQVSGKGWTAQLLAVTKASTVSSKNSLVLTTDAEKSTTVSGDSFGTMSLSKAGDIQWSGVLPDGVKVSQKSVLSKDGIWPMYSSLYGGTGALIGWLQRTNGNSELGGSAVWVVPANRNSLYPNGLTNKLNASGSSVINPPAVSHSTIILSGSHLSSPLTNSVTISGKIGQSVDKSLTLSVDVKNGLFSGSVVDANSHQTFSFQGALLEKSGIGGGFFLNAAKDQGGKVYLTPAN